MVAARCLLKQRLAPDDNGIFVFECRYLNSLHIQSTFPMIRALPISSFVR